PFGFEYPQYFEAIPKTDVPFIPHHKYTFIACLGSFNWCAIFDTPASLEMYANNHIIAPFEITWAERNRILGEHANPVTNRRPASTIASYRASDCICKPVN